MSDDLDTGPGASGTTHFGFRDVASGDKAGLVHGVFSSVASRYDVMNDVMSLRIHRLWKEALVDWLAPRPGLRLLDVAGGTGDIAFRALKRQPRAEAVICDMTADMLAAGRGRDGVGGALDWVCGDAMNLPFPDRSFDAVTIAFGVRNVTRIEDALSEAFRVLRHGGRFLCLEFSRVADPALARLYDLYSFNVIPRMGALVAGDRDSYQYLVESIRRFPDQERFAGMIRDAGFDRVDYRNLSQGVAALHSGWRI